MIHEPLKKPRRQLDLSRGKEGGLDKVQVYLEVRGEGCTAMGWCYPESSEDVMSKILSLWNKPYVWDETFLHVEVESGLFKAFAQGTDGYPKVLTRAVLLLDDAMAAYDRMHDKAEPRAMQL